MWQENKKFIMGILIGLIVGYGIGSSWSSPSVVASDKGDKKATSEMATNSDLMVKDQPAGRQVLVESVRVTAPTWVAIREDRDGAPGDIMGATLIPSAGAQSSVVVDLIIPSESSKKYHVNLYSDNGDRLFDNNQDELVKGADGLVMDATFSTQ